MMYGLKNHSEEIRTRRAFTLIELLIVVAIIAILAAIAVPNFLEAQVRSKVSRCRADMRSMATAMEAYQIDANHYPPDTWIPGGSSWPFKLTSPVAYITSLPKNPFPNEQTNIPRERWYEYSYVSEGSKELNAPPSSGPVGNMFWPGITQEMWTAALGTSKVWALTSSGPDRKRNIGEWSIYGEEILNHYLGIAFLNMGPGSIYDPTNGTMSDGDIVRSGP